MKKEYKNTDHRKQRGRTAPNRALKFVVQIRKSPSESEGWINFTLSIEKTLDALTFDEVDIEALDVFSKNINEEYYPKAEYRILIEDDDGEWYHVVSESDADGIENLKESVEIKKFLVLPDAKYYLTEEAVLWESLKKKGLVSEDDEFDYDKMHWIVEEFKRGCEKEIGK